MTERASSPVGQDELVASFEDLGVRNVYWMDFAGPARVSSVLPTYWSWHKEKPQQLGADIDQLLEDNANLRIYSLADEAIMRRKRIESFFRRRPLTWEVKGEPPIHAAEVTGVSHMDVGFGRILPVLGLMEFKASPPHKEAVISVAELAKHIQQQEARLELR